MQGQAARPAGRLDALEQRAFDLLVIGGGITGCGVARDAALRGLSVALVEKGDFASGTSSRSSRLIHGGVRYLEHGQLGLVFEASAERRRLLRLAPHLVRPLRFTWPVYVGARLPRWKLSAGLGLYDALAMFRNVQRHRRLNREQVLADEPTLQAEGLVGGATYYDAATNDARLTLANAIGAAGAGAVVVNHCAVTALTSTGSRIAGAEVRDTLTGATATVRAAVVVNATGPWSDAVRALDPSGEQSSAGARTAVRGSKGAHIAVDRRRLGNRSALTLLSPRDGRVLFVLPDGDRAIVGTTDTYTTASPDVVRASNDDVRYLLDSANAFFPDAALAGTDVVSAWAGIRPLVASPGDAPGAASREHAIATSEHGLVSITGGKLTTYRVMAAQVVNEVARRVRRRVRRCVTGSLPLPGGDFTWLPDLERTISLVIEADIGAHLARAHGRLAADVAARIRDAGGVRRLDERLPYTTGEMLYCVEREMALTLGDLLLRRTHLAFETSDHGMRAAPLVAETVAPLLGWDATARRRALDDYAVEVDRVFGIDP